MVVKCEAIINGDGVYYSGQTVIGKICVSVDERILIKSLALKISGYAQTEWDTAKKENDKPNLVNGREDYIATTTFLVGSEESTSVMIPVGNYTYSFSCTIPEKSPSSFESQSGYIRYQVRVFIHYPNRSDEVLTETLHVIRAFDLRPQALVLKLPLDMEVYEKKCCCEYWKVPMCLYVNLAQAGYVPGDTISVYARLLNDGKVPLKHLVISLNQVVTYASRIPRELTKIERYNIVQIMNGLPGKEPLREFLERIPIPSLPPTCDTDCKILQVSYEVEALVVQKKGDRGIVVRIPVLIGTTSFEDVSAPINEKEVEINEKRALEEPQPTSSAPIAIISSNSMEPEPTMSSAVVSMSAPAASSFQEAAFMSSADFGKEDKHSLNKDKSGFRPKYLYYEINEDIEMTPTTMEITKEITIAST